MLGCFRAVGATGAGLASGDNIRAVGKWARCQWENGQCGPCSVCLSPRVTAPSTTNAHDRAPCKASSRRYLMKRKLTMTYSQLSVVDQAASSVTQCHPVSPRVTQRPEEAIHWRSVAISTRPQGREGSCQRQLLAITGNQNHWQSLAITGNHWQSLAITGESRTRPDVILVCPGSPR